jgi:hypothetical protein
MKGTADEQIRKLGHRWVEARSVVTSRPIAGGPAWQ